MGSKYPRLFRLLLGIVLALVLGAGFLAYLQPAFMVDLANRVIMCF